MQSTLYINKVAANSTIIHFVHFDVEDAVQHVEKSVFIIQYSVLLVCEKISTVFANSIDPVPVLR